MYNKLFTKILDSTIWLESNEVRLVWITFIAAMDENGFVSLASPGNVAQRARVSLEEAVKALEILESPDPNGLQQENEGRRIERVDGGWIVLNAPKYREMVTRVMIQERTKNRVARFRERKRAVTDCNAHVTPCNADVTPRNVCVTQSVAEAVAVSKANNDNPLQETTVSEPRTQLNGDFVDRIAQTEVPKRLQKIYNRRETTRWSDAEIKAYRKIKDDIDLQDLKKVESYMKAERMKTKGFFRRDLLTLLNNWNGEVDRANAKDQVHPHAALF